MKNVVLFAAGVVAALVWSTWSSPAGARGGAAGIQTFLVIYRPGPAWLPGKPIAEQPIKEHGRYMLQLYKRGEMRMAGPFTDDTGGAVVLAVADAAAAKAVVTADPGVTSGLFRSEIHPWTMVDWQQYLKKK